MAARRGLRMGVGIVYGQPFCRGGRQQRGIGADEHRRRDASSVRVVSRLERTGELGRVVGVQRMGKAQVGGAIQ